MANIRFQLKEYIVYFQLLKKLIAPVISENKCSEHKITLNASKTEVFQTKFQNHCVEAIKLIKY